MRTSLLFLVPLVLIGGLLFGAYQLKGFIRSDAPCTIGTCPLTLYEGDAGKMFTYAAGTRFTLVLDERKDPPQYLTCSPDGVIQNVAAPSVVEPPLYNAVFQGVSEGTCSLVSNAFTATIIIK